MIPEGPRGKGRLRRLGLEGRAGVFRGAEAVLGLLLFVPFFFSSNWRFPLVFWLSIGKGAASSLPALLVVDGLATLPLLAVALLRIGIPMAPIAVLFSTAPWYRRLWLAQLIFLLFVPASSLSLAAGGSVAWWIVLILASATALLLQRIRWLRWTAFLPIFLTFDVVYGHAILPHLEADPASRARRLAKCQERGGQLPLGLTADLVRPYHGVTALSDELVLLTGEGPADGGGPPGARRPDGPILSSWWLRRTSDGQLEFETRSGVHGNLWRGCVLDSTIWMARANHVVGTRRSPADLSRPEERLLIRLPSEDHDFGDVACDVVGGLLFAGEATQGGLWEVDLRQVHTDGRGNTTGVRRHHLAEVVLFPIQRPDGMIAIQSTSGLTIFDPREKRIVERRPTSLVGLGFDVCGVDGSVAVPDLTGRIRVFTFDEEGRYRFDWGVSVSAPRRVAYSRDCSRLAVASADDRHVFIVDAVNRRVEEVLHGGPALREVASTGPRELSFTDVCSVTTYRW